MSACPAKEGGGTQASRARALGLREGRSDWPRRCCGGGAGVAWTQSEEGFSRRYQPSRSCASGRAPRSDRPNDLLMYVHRGLSDASIITQGLVEGQCL